MESSRLFSVTDVKFPYKNGCPDYFKAPTCTCHILLTTTDFPLQAYFVSKSHFDFYGLFTLPVYIPHTYLAAIRPPPSRQSR